MQNQLNVLVELPFKYMNQNIKFLLIHVLDGSAAYFLRFQAYSISYTLMKKIYCSQNKTFRPINGYRDF